MSEKTGPQSQWILRDLLFILSVCAEVSAADICWNKCNGERVRVRQSVGLRVSSDLDVITEKHSNLPNTLSNHLLQVKHKRTHTSSSMLVSALARHVTHFSFFLSSKARFT